MANEEHVKILKRGAKTWTRWRKDHPDVLPDLGEANLSMANLSMANLSMANLSMANLSMANLSGANLSGANLAVTDLHGANLIEANLRRANLSMAFLSMANLSRADLSRAHLGGTDLVWANLWRANLSLANLSGAGLGWANLSGADLGEANFTNAVLEDTTFGNNDLCKVKGLETVRHRGPSTIGLDTIYKSKGTIPEVFLRGCGVPEDFIVYMRTLVGKPIKFYSCFISYSSNDDDFAKRLYADLQAQNVRCWFAPEDLKIGDKFRMRIDEAIRIHDKLLLVLSGRSVKSAWVEKEAETAFEKERRHDNKPVLFPIRLDDAVMEAQEAWAADIRRTRHIGDFTRWKEHDAYQKAFQRLLRDLKSSEK